MTSRQKSIGAAGAVVLVALAVAGAALAQSFATGQLAEQKSIGTAPGNVIPAGAQQIAGKAGVNDFQALTVTCGGGKCLLDTSTTPAAGATTPVNLAQVLGAAHSATNPVYVEASTALSARIPAVLGAGGGLKIDGSGTALPVSAASLPLPTGAATSVLQGGGLPAALGAGGGLKVDGSGTALTVSGTVTATVASTTLTATVLPAAATHETSALAFQVGIAATLMGTATAGRKSLQIHNPGGSGRSIYCGVTNGVTATNANSIWEVEPGQNWAEPFPTATTVYCIAALATYASWTGIF